MIDTNKACAGGIQHQNSEQKPPKQERIHRPRPAQSNHKKKNENQWQLARSFDTSARKCLIECDSQEQIIVQLCSVNTPYMRTKVQ